MMFIMDDKIIKTILTHAVVSRWLSGLYRHSCCAKDPYRIT